MRREEKRRGQDRTGQERSECGAYWLCQLSSENYRMLMQIIVFKVEPLSKRIQK